VKPNSRFQQTLLPSVSAQSLFRTLVCEASPKRLRAQTSGPRCMRCSTRLRHLLFSEDRPPTSDEGPQSVMPQSDTFPWKSVSTTKDPTPITVPIANQTRGHDQGATEHFVKRFARAAPLPYRGLHAARRNEAADSLDGLPRPLTPTQTPMEPAIPRKDWAWPCEGPLVPSGLPTL